MLVVHVSLSPLAGAPIRLVNALNAYTDIQARLVNFNPNCYGSRTFPEDLSWRDDTEECICLIKQADIIHLHHFINIENAQNPFNFDFRKEVKKGCHFIRHFHSDLEYVSGHNKNKARQILEDPLPKLVIPHCPERTYPNAVIVPNIVPIHEDIFLPSAAKNDKIKVFYSSSTKASRWEERWQTKGWPEIIPLLRKISEDIGFEFIEAYGIPYKECQSLKQTADIVIGDIVTGSYHLTELEALAQGKVVICNPDARTLLTLFNLTGCRDLPFVVSGVETLHDVLKHIVSHPSLIKDIGKFSRKWAETYYNDKILIQNYVKIYKDLISGKPIIRSGSSDYAEAKNFLYNSLFDIEYNYHKKATLSLFKLKCLYWRKKLLSKITFGKKRKRFKQERKALKKQIKKLKAL